MSYEKLFTQQFIHSVTGQKKLTMLGVPPPTTQKQQNVFLIYMKLLNSDLVRKKKLITSNFFNTCSEIYIKVLPMPAEHF